MSRCYDFEIPQGADHEMSFRAVVDGEAVDYAGAQARMQMRRLRTSDSAADTLTTENGRIVYDSENRFFSALWPHSVSEKLPAGSYYYDVEIVSTDGRVERLLEGRAIVTQEVTR